MLSVSECRKQLGAEGAALSDAEIERLRDSMVLWAGVTLDRVQRLSRDVIEEARERACIMEFDGRLTRADAERAAMLSVIEGGQA
jgi:hypothetical protein